MNTHRYSTDLSDAEWAVLEPHLPQPQPRGRPRLHSICEILNAIFYILRSGCAWRLLPRDLPPWKTVYHYVRLWRLTGRWERLNAAVRQRLRVQMGRAAHPSAGIIDSQSVKTTGVGGPRGFDGGTKVNGRTRHLLVETHGLLVPVVVHPADLPDCAGVTLVLAEGHELSPRLRHLWLNGSDKGRGKAWIETTLGWTVSIVQHSPKLRGVWAPADAVIDWAALLPPPGFRVLRCAGLAGSLSGAERSGPDCGGTDAGVGRRLASAGHPGPATEHPPGARSGATAAGAAPRCLSRWGRAARRVRPQAPRSAPS